MVEAPSTACIRKLTSFCRLEYAYSTTAAIATTAITRLILHLFEKAQVVLRSQRINNASAKAVALVNKRPDHVKAACCSSLDSHAASVTGGGNVWR